MATVRQLLQDALSKGTPLPELKQRMEELGIRQEDLDLEYAQARQKGQQRIEPMLQQAVPFIAPPEPVRRTETPTPPPAPAEPVKVVPAPAQDPGRGVLAGGGAPQEEKVGEFAPSQLVRPLGMVAGALGEAGRLGVELGVQTLAGVEEAGAQIRERFGMETEPISQRSADLYRRQLGKALGLSPAETRQALEPQTTKKLFDEMAGRKTIAQQKQAEIEDKSTLEKAQEDLGNVVGGVINFMFTDIIPLIPSPTPKTVAQELKAAAERGEGIPGFPAVAVPIIARAAEQVADGDTAGAADTILSKAPTIALTMLPFAGRLPAKTARAVAAAAERVAPRTAQRAYAKAQRAVADPLAQPTRVARETAETIFEEARAERTAAGRAVETLAEEAREVPAVEAPTPRGVEEPPQVIEPRETEVIFSRMAPDAAIEGAGRVTFAKPELDFVYEVPNKVANEVFGELMEARPGRPPRPETRRMIDEAVLDLVEDNGKLLLASKSIRKRIANYLADQAFPIAEKKAASQRIEGQLETWANSKPGTQLTIDLGDRGAITTVDLIGIAPEKAINIPQAVLENVGFTEGALKAQVKQRIKERVERQVFVDAIRDGLKTETVPAGVTQAVVPEIITRRGELPQVIEVSPDVPWTRTVASLEAKGIPKWAVDELNSFVEPSPTLQRMGVPANVRMSPGFNESFTMVLDGLAQVAQTQGVANYVTSAFKRAFTTRNLVASMNNYKSSTGLYGLYYGATEGLAAFIASLGEGTAAALNKSRVPVLDRVAAFNENTSAYRRYVENKPASELEGRVFRAMENSGLIDRNAAAAEVSLADKGGLLTDAVEKGLGKTGETITRPIKAVNAAQDRFYQFGDNYYKFLSTFAEVREAITYVDKMAPGERVTIRIGEFRNKTLEKNPNGTMSDVATGDVLTDGQLLGDLTQGAAVLSKRKFIDYERVPGYINWLRSNPSGLGGLVSLFLTWGWKIADIPGLKRGIVSEFITNERVVMDGNSKAGNAYLRERNVQRGFNRAALVGAAQKAFEDQEGDLQKMVAWNKKTMAPIYVMVSQVDPYTLIYNDQTSANFFGPSETAARILMGATFFGAEKAKSVTDFMVSNWSKNTGVRPNELLMDLSATADLGDREQNALQKEIRKLYTRYKAGQLVSPAEVAQFLGASGGPLFDFLETIQASEKNPNVDIGAFVSRTLWSALMGGTGKRMLIDTIAPEVFGGEEGMLKKGATVPFMADVYRRANAIPFRGSNKRGLVTKLVNGLFGQAWRTAFVHNYAAGKGKMDLGAQARWANDFSKNLSASMKRQYQKRYDALVAAGVKTDDPAMLNLELKLDYLDNIIANEKERFLNRLESVKDRAGIK